MRMIDLIQKKKHGEEMSAEEIDYIVQGYTKGIIPDYQMSAFLMAVYFKGMTKKEIADLTSSFVGSGETVDLSGIQGVKVDKHSTGGVGDKISLIVIPLVASVGVPVAKMSGRGLGHTGGTIDKLEAIEGFRTELTNEQFISNVNNCKMAIVGQTANLTPADKKIYALRDVTATVDSIPLIASSIMSKKIASGADAIVLDVKVGSGAFMKTIEEAELLAQTMVDIGKSLNRKTVAVITDMSQPLGHEVGNANEIREAIQVLMGRGSEDETTIALTIASNMAVLGGAFDDFKAAYKHLEGVIASGEAISKLKELVKIQGGNPDLVDNPEKLPQAKYHIPVPARKDGYVSKIEAEQIGVAAMLLGAGRKTKEDSIDPAAGITLVKKVGDKVKAGEAICMLHTNLQDATETMNVVEEAFSISEDEPAPVVYLYSMIR
jgi:pyrimidine-nucleoside phosphorylase/thymidine phosphorylase